jgi:hypothetical protein
MFRREEDCFDIVASQVMSLVAAISPTKVHLILL